jgi:choline dehydrogenase
VIDHGYLTDPHDLAVLLEGIERARELAATEPLRSLIGVELVPGVDAPLEETICRSHVHYYHPVGTCRLGAAGDPLAVCDARGRLHGLDRIVVADCSLMPVVPRANTNVPAVVGGARHADQLLGGGPDTGCAQRADPGVRRQSDTNRPCPRSAKTGAALRP